METEKKIRIAQMLCLIPGLFLIVSGLMLLFFPIPAKALFDLQDINIFKQPIALSFGIRQFSIGLIIFILAVSNQTKALAYIMLIGSIVPLVDFIIFIPSIGFISALRHFAPIPLIVGLGVYLIIKLNEKHIRHKGLSWS